MAWHMMVAGQPGAASSNYFEFMLDDEADINTEPTEFGTIAPGSVAYTNKPGSIGMEKMFMKCSNGTWNEM